MNPLRKFVMSLGMLVIIAGIMGQRSPPAKAPDTPPLSAPEVKAARVVKEFPSYQSVGRQRRNVVVAPDNSIEALTALAKRLHAEDPKSSFAIFTDGNESQFRRYMLWDLHYTKADTARYPYPQAWADRHYIAIINQFAYSWRDLRWQLQLFRGDGVKPPVDWGYTVDLD
jgi:hypothetical protein